MSFNHFDYMRMNDTYGHTSFKDILELALDRFTTPSNRYDYIAQCIAQFNRKPKIGRMRFR